VKERQLEDKIAKVGGNDHAERSQDVPRADPKLLVFPVEDGTEK
jgi:hypothetical protein